MKHVFNTSLFSLKPPSPSLLPPFFFLFFDTLHSLTTPPLLISHGIKAMTGYHNPISETIVLSTSQHTKKPRSELNMHSADYIMLEVGGNNYGQHWEISFCVIVSAVQCCVQCSLHVLSTKYPILGCQQQVAEVGGGG